MNTTAGPNVFVDGCPFVTIIDDDDTQRFPGNRIVELLLDTGKLDLNALWFMYNAKMFTRKELMSFYMDLGYSLSGFADIFPNVDIVNPLWDDSDEAEDV